jgi:hypothetical protein
MRRPGSFSLSRVVHGSALVLILVTAGASATPALADTIDLPQENAWARVTPSVVWCDDAQSLITIEVHIVGRNDVEAVRVENGPINVVALYDDGTHGDVAAGDNVFTRSGVQPYCSPYQREVSQEVGVWNLGVFLSVTLTGGVEAANRYPVAVGMVDPRFKDAFEVVQLGDRLSATAYAFFIDDSAHEVFEGYPVAPIYCGKGNYAAYQKLYSVLPDVFDFALVMPGEQMLRPGDFAENTPYHVTASNAVQNIGLPVENNTALFGSAEGGHLPLLRQRRHRRPRDRPLLGGRHRRLTGPDRGGPGGSVPLGGEQRHRRPAGVLLLLAGWMGRSLRGQR